MGQSLNRVELKGNVGFDPHINTFEEGDKMMRFSLATNETYKNRRGEFVEETVWHNVVAWAGKSIPEFETIKKGDYLYVTGRIRPIQYQTKDGKEKNGYEVVAFSIKPGENN